MSAATARYEDIADHRLHQLRPGRRGEGRADRRGRRPAGAVDRGAVQPDARDPRRATSPSATSPGLYIYDNTLLGVKLTGAQVKAYLEKSAAYFKPAPAPGTYTIGGPHQRGRRRPRPTARPTTTTTRSGGLDQPLTYDIDLGQPVGSRIIGLAYGGVAGRPTRRSSSSRSTTTGSPAAATSRRVSRAPVVYNRQVEIRQLLIDWVTAHGMIDPASSPRRLEAGLQGADVTITDDRAEPVGPSPASRARPTGASRRRRAASERGPRGGHAGDRGRAAPLVSNPPGRRPGRCPDAVVGGDPADVDPVDLVVAQPVGEDRAVVGRALETRVGRGVLALGEDRVERLRGRGSGGTPRPRCRPGSAPARSRRSRARRRSGRRGRRGGPGGHDVVVGRSAAPLQRRRCRRRPGRRRRRQRAALAEVVLHVDDDQAQ